MAADGRLTRRELLAASGAGAALALAGCGGDGEDDRATVPRSATASTRAAPAPMLKGVSLIGEHNPYADLLDVRPYLLGGPRPVQFLSLWLEWPRVQPAAPRPFTRAQAFRDLSAPDGPGAATFAWLDAQIAQANRDGLTVSLVLYQSFPAWTRPSAGVLDPARDPLAGGAGYPELGQDGLPHDARVPDELGPDGPWAWLVAYLCARYADTNGEPTPGPGVGGAVAGNPSAAHVAWLQPLNEPNLTWWPQRAERYPGGTIAGAVAQLVRSAGTVADAQRASGAHPPPPGLLVPNTADVVDADSTRGTDWRAFTRELLGRLAGWRPATPVGWAQHNYADVKHGPVGGRWRAQEAIELLARHGWPDPALWLTEGGYQFGVRRDPATPGRWVVDPERTADPAQPDVFAEQVAAIEANWEAMARLPVRLWSQYQVNDVEARFQSSLRGPIRRAADGTPRPHDPPYPIYARWPALGA